eukprot:GCRY01003906.1.p1 GENE.GCRY01003906.1~~GCRY01003906.1.p1  ORF type:complete len:189 (+),score=8.93 GCRY01003906.1:121-687(+)
MIKFGKHPLVQVIFFALVLSALMSLRVLYHVANVDYQNAGFFNRTLPSLTVPAFLSLDFILNQTSVYNEVCQNTIQGAFNVTDNAGFICSRFLLPQSKCCPSNSSQFYCGTCDTNHCCLDFETCVSCCLNPDNLPTVQSRFLSLQEQNRKFASLLSSHFSVCLALCRTSSRSVIHENSFRSNYKHCYG